MARAVNRLTARSVASMKDPGRFADGGGLYLVIDKAGAKRWAYLFRQKGKLREMGLGSAGSVSLARARELAATARAHVAEGRDPIELRRSERTVPKFGKFADALVEDLAPQWRNEKHVAQWRMTLTKYAAGLREKPLDEISTDDVLAVLRPIWATKAETAYRLRGRIERVLDAAKAKGFRSGENPARWRGHLDHLLPKRQKLTRGHHEALPYGDVPKFMAALQSRDGAAARALEFLILTATRTTEVRGARWDEMDLDAKTWTVPAHRMKAGREHRIPLSGAALKVLRELAETRASDFVFPGMAPDAMLSDGAMERVLDRMKVKATVHGFRSSFRDWASECTDHPREVAEAALAHLVGDATERAYRRGDALEKRRALMTDWASFCGETE